MTHSARVDLYWLPLGAGAVATVRWSGRLYEAIAAHRDHRAACDLYHSALQVHVGDHRFVIEMAPVWGNKQPDRGVVSEGAVGLPWLGHSRFFRYEVRRWPGGTIPDIAAAVASPQHLSTDVTQAQRLLDLVPDFPTVTWGRDELHTGEMWNSNSLIAWLLTRSGHRTDLVRLPAHSRAPGWSAGLTVASRDVQPAAASILCGTHGTRDVTYVTAGPARSAGVPPSPLSFGRPRQEIRKKPGAWCSAVRSGGPPHREPAIARQWATRPCPASHRSTAGSTRSLTPVYRRPRRWDHG